MFRMRLFQLLDPLPGRAGLQSPLAQNAKSEERRYPSPNVAIRWHLTRRVKRPQSGKTIISS